MSNTNPPLTSNASPPENKKLGRNDPCYCGSGKKYKKCHLDEVERVIIPSMIQKISQKNAEDLALTNMGIKMNFVRPATSQDGRKAWAIRNRVYYNRPANETFHEFIIWILKTNLGEAWRSEQAASSDKHFIYKCFESFDQLRKDGARPENKQGEHVWSVELNGWSKYLLALAFDIATLQNAQPIPDSLLNRLRHRDQFQGARYEIGIAALFARLGYTITFLDTITPANQTHCEFIAKSISDGLEIAVEAKSRHRPGVLHAQGTYDHEKALKGDVARLYHKAITQSPGDVPFLIFIDLNSPPSKSHEAIQAGWNKDIKDMLQREIDANPTVASIPTAIYITNFAYHYDRQGQPSGNEMSEFISTKPQHEIKSPIFYQNMEKALAHYGTVPNYDEDRVYNIS